MMTFPLNNSYESKDPEIEVIAFNICEQKDGVHFLMTIITQGTFLTMNIDAYKIHHSHQFGIRFYFQYVCYMQLVLSQ